MLKIKSFPVSFLGFASLIALTPAQLLASDNVEWPTLFPSAAAAAPSSETVLANDAPLLSEDVYAEKAPAAVAEPVEAAQPQVNPFATFNLAAADVSARPGNSSSVNVAAAAAYAQALLQERPDAIVDVKAYEGVESGDNHGATLRANYRGVEVYIQLLRAGVSPASMRVTTYLLGSSDDARHQTVELWLEEAGQ